MTTTLEFVLSAIDKASDVVTKVGDSSERAGSKMSTVMNGVAGAGAATAVVAFGNASIEAYSDAEKSAKSLQFQLDQFPATADTNAQAIYSLTGALQTKTGVDDDAAAAAAGQLAAFNLTGAQIEELLPLMEDYSARTGKDMSTSADDLGKALMGQGRALKTLGIDFTDTGSTAGNFDQLVSGLRTQVGGYAEEEGKTAEGTTKRLAASYGDLQETVGELLVPTLTKVTEVGVGLTSWMTSHKGLTQGLAVVIGGLALAYGVASVAQTFAAASSALRGTTLATETAATATATAANVPFAASLWAISWPILAIVAAIALVVLGVYELVTHWDTVKAAIGTGAEWIKDKFVEGFDWLKDNWPLVLGILTGPIGLASAWVIENWDQVSTFFTELPGKMWDGLTGVFDLLVNGDYTGKLASSLGLEEDSPIIGGILDLRDKVVDFFDGVAEGFVRPFKQGFHDVAVLWNETLGSFDWQMPWWMGGFHITIPQVAVPALAAGGIVTAPTLALIGEAGPEAVVPLSGASRYGVGAAGDRTIVVPVMIDGREVARVVARANAEAL